MCMGLWLGEFPRPIRGDASIVSNPVSHSAVVIISQPEGTIFVVVVNRRSALAV